MPSLAYNLSSSSQMQTFFSAGHLFMWWLSRCLSILHLGSGVSGVEVQKIMAAAFVPSFKKAGHMQGKAGDLRALELGFSHSTCSRSHKYPC